MTYHIQPANGDREADRVAHVPALPANGENVKVVQELLRHGSAKITMDVYAQGGNAGEA